jgi:predicted NAD-dependent protein-ADP-ribosyltransferase YbiA (DUF1768 family)
MVKSLLIPDIEYPEIRSLLPEDKELSTSLYDITLFNKDEEIALGNPVYTFVERNIVYYPIYLLKNDKVVLQIGLYEVFASEMDNFLDTDGDVDLLLIGSPLLYGFVKDFLSPITEKKELVTIALEEQSKADSEKESSTYIKDNKNHWIQHYFKNNNYKMIDNEGKGDCLFAVIRDALEKVGVEKSVNDMRKILADNVAEDIYQGYKTIFQDAFDTDKQLETEIKVLVSRHKELKKKIGELKDRNEKQAVIIQADEINKRHTLLKKERSYTKSVVQGELKMMKNVHNLTQFKALIKTCAFWGDTWAISTLERVLNIKIILFSEESYKAGDLENVLTCGQLNDTILEEKGIFEPDYYILTIYQGYHYQLLSYKDKGALTFKELPYDVKIKVVDKCLERLAGPYYIIPDFRKFMELEQASAVAILEPAVPVPAVPVPAVPAVPAVPVPAVPVPAVPVPALASEEMQSDLYNNSIIFQFYINSLDKPAGKGAGETIPQGDIEEYKDLTHIKDWRRKLDNLWISPFTLDGHKWNSVEHYYQGSKFKKGDKDFYLQFSLDSGSELSKDPEMAIGAGGKSGKFAKEQIRPQNIKVDDDFSKGRGPLEMEAAQYAKFSQNVDLKNLLLSTKKAKLQHFSKGSPPTVFTELMQVRKRLL